MEVEERSQGHLAKKSGKSADTQMSGVAECAEKEEVLKECAERLKAVREVGRAILVAQSPDEIAHFALDHIRQLVPCQRASLVLFDWTAHEGRTVAVHVDGETRVDVGTRSSLGSVLDTIEMLRQGKVCVAEDVSTLAPRLPVAHALQLEGIRSITSVPLIVQDTLIGSINLGKDTPGAFDSEQINIVREMATSLAVAFQNAQLSQAQRESEERYRSVYTKNPAMLHSIGRSGRLVDVSDRWLEVLGYHRSEVIGRKSTEFLTEESRDYAETVALPEIMAAGYMRDVSYQFVKGDGDIIDVLLSAIAEGDEEGNLLQSLAVLTDVTERKRAENALRKSEERFRNIFSHSNDAILVVDPVRDEFIDVNTKACSMLGYSYEELLFLSVSAVHPDEIPQLRSFLDSTVEHGRGWTDELQCVTKSGQIIPAEISASVIDIDGRACVLALVRDITARSRKGQSVLDEAKEKFEEIIGESQQFKRVLEQAEIVAPTDTTVLILGETGTGKELICRAIHHFSPRNTEPIVKLNCAAIPSSLVESELFGHERGAFTGAVTQRQGRFELADGGTIFLDEIGDLPLEAQAKLLRVLEDQEFERVGGTRRINVDVRVIAATNRDLEQMVGDGEFRKDLFYRLNVFPIRLPPLRERTEDIPALVDYLTRRKCAILGRPPCEFSASAMHRMRAYSWPGNVRELQNIVERAVILCSEQIIDLEHVQVESVAPFEVEEEIRPLQEVERAHILTALRAVKGRVRGVGGAAEQLGLKPTTLESRMKKLGIRRGVL